MKRTLRDYLGEGKMDE